MKFADSNVLLYLASDDSDKAAIATGVLNSHPVVSVQVLNEVVSVTRRKFGRSWPDVREFLDRIAPLVDVRPVTLETHRRALMIAERYQTGWWDALIVAAALEAECDKLYSEDMHAGLVIDDRVRIVNPFA